MLGTARGPTWVRMHELAKERVSSRPTFHDFKHIFRWNFQPGDSVEGPPRL